MINGGSALYRVSARLRPKVRRRSTNELKLIVLDPAINISRLLSHSGLELRSQSPPSPDRCSRAQRKLSISKLSSSFPRIMLHYFSAFRFDPDLDSSSCLFPPHAFLIPNDGAIVFAPVVFVLFGFLFFFLCPRCSLILGVLCVSKVSAVFGVLRSIITIYSLLAIVDDPSPVT